MFPPPSSIQYRAEPEQVEAGVVVGEIPLSTVNFAEGVLGMDALKLTAYQCIACLI